MMLVEIEYYKENVLLYGKRRTYAEFRRQMEEIEAIYDEVEDKHGTKNAKIEYTIHGTG